MSDSPLQNASPADLLAGVREGTYSDRETDALAACVLGGEWVSPPKYPPTYKVMRGHWLSWREGIGWFYLNRKCDHWTYCGPLLVEYQLCTDWHVNGDCEVEEPEKEVITRNPNPCRAITDAALMVELGKWVAKGEGE